MFTKPTYDELSQKIKDMEFELDMYQSLDNKSGYGKFILNSFSDHANELMGIIELLDDEHDLRYIWLNKSAGRYLGKSPKELQGMRASELGVSKEVLCMWIDECHKNDLTGTSEQFEYKRKFPDGIHTLLASTSKIKSQYFSFIIFDITQQKRTEEMLRSREQLLNEMGRIAKIGGWEHDLITGEAIWTKATYQIVELESEGFIPGPEKHLAYYPAKDREILEKAYQLSIKTGKRFDNELQAITAKGRPIFVRVVGHPEYKDGNCVKMKGTIQDITEYKMVEMKLQQAQKMESIGTLAGGIAHDFNNILFPIVGHAEMLLEDAPEDSSLRDSLNEIYTGALRARDLVQQILAFSRHEKNELELMNIQPIIKEAMKLIRSTIPATISITQNLQPDCGSVVADPTQIHQIVMNLTTNAYHAMEESGGELKVNLKEIELGEYDLIFPDMSPGLYACLSIADTGVGINKDVMNRIFDPFFTTKERGKGTGMGLSVVHGIVKRMNGEIQVYSEPGKGTEFHIYLPIVRNASEEQDPIITKPIPGGLERLLLVDDEEGIIVVEKQILERLGYHITSRTSSIEALEVFKANPDKFDLVITDMSMPKMSGDKLAVELIKIRPDIPVLLCTGFSESMTDEKIKYLGIKGLLMKPIVIKDLAKKLREILDSSDKNISE